MIMGERVYTEVISPQLFLGSPYTVRFFTGFDVYHHLPRCWCDGGKGAVHLVYFFFPGPRGSAAEREALNKNMFSLYVLDNVCKI